jgi:Tol biopolymer transport system component
VAYAAQENGAGEIWVQDLSSDTRTRLTFTQADESAPVWIPGQDRIAFTTTVDGHSTVSARSAGGSGEVEVLIEDGENPVFTADGTWMIFQRTSDTKAGLMRVPTDGSEEPEMFRAGNRSNLYQPELSPDGHYVAYLSWEQGTATTYICPFPTGEGKWELPGSWESVLCWLPDRIVYTTDRPEPAVMEVPVSLSGSISLGTARKLFELRPNRIVRSTSFASTPDGKRLLMVQDTAEAFEVDQLALVENWVREFR